MSSPLGRVMHAFHIWLPVLLGILNLAVAMASFAMARRARRHADQAELSRRDAQAALASMMALRETPP